MTIFHYIIIKMHNTSKVDELQRSWDDFRENCHYEGYHSDLNYHMALNTIFSVVQH